jgi:hypothetical protein
VISNLKSPHRGNSLVPASAARYDGVCLLSAAILHPLTFLVMSCMAPLRSTRQTLISAEWELGIWENKSFCSSLLQQGENRTSMVDPWTG